MTDESLIRHKTYTIPLMSDQRDGEWVPLALVSRPGQRLEDGHQSATMRGFRYALETLRMPQPRNWPLSELIRSFRRRPINPTTVF
jgi:hypothetical protein